MTDIYAQTHPGKAVARLRRLQFVEEVSGEHRELAALPQLMEGCDRFIDVGANIGLYIFHANRVLHSAEILAIEANPALRPELEKTFEEARKDRDNGNHFAVETCAILDKPGSVDFFVTPNLDDSSIFSTRIGGAEKVSVGARPLDAFYKQSKKTIVKMDIEGAEYRAIKSAPKFLRSGHTEFLLELHPWGDAKIRKYPLQVCNLFFLNGFGCKRIYHHYHFLRVGLAHRALLYIASFPHLLMMWLAHRYTNGFGRTVQRIHNFLAKIRRAVFS